MRYRNLLWALSNWGTQYRLAREVDCSESRLSRCLSGRSNFTRQERASVARVLGFSEHWLFEEIQLPERNVPTEMRHAHA